MGLENAPKPKLSKIDVGLTQHPDDVRQLKEKKQEAAKDVLAKLPGGKKSGEKPEGKPAIKSENLKVKTLTPEQQKRQDEMMKLFTEDVDIGEEKPKKRT